MMFNGYRIILPTLAKTIVPELLSKFKLGS